MQVVQCEPVQNTKVYTPMVGSKGNNPLPTMNAMDVIGLSWIFFEEK